jgi:hypothetical protein
MLNSEDQRKIKQLATEFWNDEVGSVAFRSIFGGKEKGHRIADYVDEKTTELLSREMDTGYLRDKNGKPADRSMGDVWIKSNGVFHPLNVKAGEYSDQGGNPNLVALNKVLTALLERKIDSYYLLIIKMQVTDKEGLESVIPRVYLVDMLDHLDVVNFDSGPGQLMLKEKQFYLKMSSEDKTDALSLAQKIEKLIELKEKGDETLIANRLTRSRKLKELKREYEESSQQNLDQRDMNIG